MKLIELLVKELPKLGGWPEFATICWCDPDGEIRFDKDTGRDFYPSPDFVNKDERALGIGNASSGVTRDQYEATLAKNDGWIEWGGGECPVHESANVDIKLEDGSEKSDLPASAFIWQHDDDVTNIIAYRLHKPGIKSRANNDRLEQDLNECIGQDVDMPEWSGDGLPPVGCECEVRFGGFSWVTCKVVYRGDAGVAFVYSDNSTIDCVGTGRDDYFRPLRTEAEKAREKLAASLHAAAGASPIELNGIGPLYFKLSDAIISGSVFGTTFKAGK